MKGLVEFHNQKVREADEVLKRGFLLGGEEVVVIRDGWKVTYKHDGKKLTTRSCAVEN